MRFSYLVNETLTIFWWLIILRIFLTWIPSINWEKQPFSILKDFADFFLEPFRKLIPPMGGLDFSPIVALIVYQLLQALIVQAIAYLGF